ncbi:hypothetical protein A3I42_03235 [Candidatus Uhrbacteria bacterium RIFCSPLOWO2_02_FULL_49_11]|uniref:Uncharacterized protein n=1 Tax=Candidatus Uhrbacteria bacterium RIFCSPLOWO2_02_FULL_49_11 TaxID=1802409 RepID=A0A1F7VE03_9BACT|nr:MAG: hypothetical protein A3I42_03235 [Candidatus Uhrbacteria bacterium RIFCSPLOWO2_02_FULL_49_11]
MRTSLAIHVVRLVVVDVLLDIFTWPTWWCTLGLWTVLKWVGRGIANEWFDFGLGPWLKSMFTPMYADYSLAGRAISFVARIIILTFRFVQFFLWLVLYMVALALYIALPLGAAYFLISFYRTS